MRIYLVLFCLFFSLAVFSQRKFAGVYEQETICCHCKLDMKPNFNFKLNCTRHYQKPLIEKGTWSINRDTITLKTDSSVIHFSIVNENVFKRIESESDKYAAMLWREFINQKNYHDNWTISIEKSWKYFKRQGTVKHGEWKYFDRDGTLEKIEIYRRGKLRKIKAVSDN